MLSIKILCVGKLKEAYYFAACEEYLKRLSAYSKLELLEIKEARLPDHPSPEQIDSALLDEGARMMEAIPKGAFTTALCIEGNSISSEEFARKISLWQSGGASKLCFLIGGSNGLSEEVKNLAQFRLSMSEMTFPHHLARVMLLEQLYRAFQISSGGKYHK